MDEQGKAKIPWDSNFKKGSVRARKVGYNNPSGDKQESLITDVVAPGDQHVIMEAREKINKCEDQTIGIAKT